jgi:spore germination protein GerM
VTQDRLHLRGLIGAVLSALALVALVAGCGIPTESSARPIDRSALPQTLVEQPTTTTVPSDPAGKTMWADLFLVSSKNDVDTLASTKVEILNVVDTASFPRQVIEQLIAQQPREGSVNDLTNAIPPTLQVLNASLDDAGVLDLDLSDLGTVEGSAQRLAAAQIVFTATAIPDINGVRFSIDGEPAAVPLDEHAADVGQVVTRDDYKSLKGS